MSATDVQAISLSPMVIDLRVQHIWNKNHKRRFYMQPSAGLIRVKEYLLANTVCQYEPLILYLKWEMDLLYLVSQS